MKRNHFESVSGLHLYNVNHWNWASDALHDFGISAKCYSLEHDHELNMYRRDVSNLCEGNEN